MSAGHYLVLHSLLSTGWIYALWASVGLMLVSILFKMLRRDEVAWPLMMLAAVTTLIGWGLHLNM